MKSTICLLKAILKHLPPPHKLNLSPLKYDTVSFGAMKKDEFDGIDLAVVKKFKPPIEEFNSNEDLQNWCFDKINELKKENINNKHSDIPKKRIPLFKKWHDYVLSENNNFTGTTALLILDGIIKNLEESDSQTMNTPLAILHEDIVADTIDEIQAGKRVNFDFLYRENLENFYCADLKDTGWITIPSQAHDPENFEDNVNKAKLFSSIFWPHYWAALNDIAESYLKAGDYHIYFENQKPKLIMSFDKDKIKEIKGRKDEKAEFSRRCPDIVKDYKAELKAKKIETIKKDLAEAIENNDAKTIYEYFGIKCKNINRKTKLSGAAESMNGEDGTLVLSHYKSCIDSEFKITYEDIGIDEQQLFKKVKKIKNNADFRYSHLTNLENLESIGGSADFENSEITDLKNLKYIGGYANFDRSKIKNLGALETIEGHLSIYDMPLTEEDFENVNIKHYSSVKSRLKDDIRYCTDSVKTMKDDLLYAVFNPKKRF